MAASYSGTGVANDVTAVIKNITTRMDEIVMKETVTAGMTASQDILDAFGRSATAKLATVNTAGLGNYDTVKGYPLGQTTIKWEEYTLAYDRAIKIDIDRKDKLQTDGLMSTAAAAASLMRTQVVPEVDATRISQAVKKTKAAKADHVVEGVSITNANILSKIGEGLDKVYDDYGMDSGLTIYLNNSLRGALRGSTEVQKVRQVSGVPALDLTTNSIDGNQIVWVPTARMGSEYTYTDLSATGTGGGVTKTASKADINFLITAPGCAQGVTVIGEPKFVDASVNQTKDADSLMYRIYHDVIVEKNSGAAGIFASVGTVSSS